MTPHNEAGRGDYAEAVLLPGDPDRAAWIADTLLERPRRVNAIRGALGFTGSWRGMPVSVQSTGIGRPSLSIYVHELIVLYGAKRIVRIGTCGGLQAHVGLRALIVAQSAAMDADAGREDGWLLPDAALLSAASAQAAADGLDHHVAPMVCSDHFYHPQPLGRFAAARERGALACDMETSEIFALAARLGARALSVCTVVDSLVTRAEIARSERQAVFGPMARLALDALLRDAA